jgi:hypothetical protein
MSPPARAQAPDLEVPKALSTEQYEQLIRTAQAAVVDEPLAGSISRLSRVAFA